MVWALFFVLLTKQDIALEVQKYVCKGCEFKILGIWIPGKKDISNFDDFELFPRDSKQIGRKIFDVLLKSKDGKMSWATLFVWVERYEEVAVLKKPVQRGEKLSQKFVEFVKMPATTVPPDAITRDNFEKFEGKVFTVDLKRGKILRKANLEENWSVRKGQRIKIVWKDGALYIETLGLALDSGKEGDRIRVRNLTSGKIIWGKIFRGTVIVND